MKKRVSIFVVSLLYIFFIQVMLPIAYSADSTVTPSVSPIISTTITPIPTISGRLTTNPTPSTFTAPTPTSVPKTTTPIKRVSTPTPLPTVTPIPRLKVKATPTPIPQINTSTSNTPTPPPSIAKSIVNFPKNLLSYIAPKDVYGTSSLSIMVSLELLALGYALIVVGVLVLRWEESGARIKTELKQIGVFLRSWLL